MNNKLLQFLTSELPELTNLVFMEEVEDDLIKLVTKVDEDCLEEAFNALRKLNANPRLGKRLEDKYGMDLTDYFKHYVCNANVRIVYKQSVVDGQLIAEIWTIACRKDFEAYVRTFNRLQARKR